MEPNVYEAREDKQDPRLMITSPYQKKKTKFMI